MARPDFTNGEFYHVYNRGVDKRQIFMEVDGSQRFLDCMREFNTIKPIDSLYVHTFRSANQKVAYSKKLVRIIAYCLNPNHFHLLLQQISKGGISEFMKRLGGGYTNFFNEKLERVGSLFQGRYKVKHITSNDYLLHVSAYVNLNDKVHRIKSPVIKSSWCEYEKGSNEICHTKFIIDQFKDKKEYIDFAENALILMLETKDTKDKFSDLLIE